jgi:hypothetical protein
MDGLAEAADGRRSGERGLDRGRNRTALSGPRRRQRQRIRARRRM